MKPATTVSRAALALLATALTPSSGRAQAPVSSQAVQQAIQQNPGLADQLRQRIQSSGLTPDQVRSRLQSSGYPSNMLDAYLGPAQPGQGILSPGASELAAVRALGIMSSSLQDEALRIAAGLQFSPADSIPAESLAVGNYVFGSDVFRRTATQYLPLLSGPVPADYRLGAGDQVVLILTGDVEMAYTLPVTREGFVLIPQVGQVFVSNLTMDQVREVLYARLGRLYSSLKPDTDAKTHLALSVANVRVNQIYVVGEVKQPGSYQISGLGTALTALYAAGGATRNANMRQIEVRRQDRVVATLDLYDYLLRGVKRDDIRLETGDVVFVHLRTKRAQITGAVLRPAIYDLKPDETLVDLLRTAGGFGAQAALARLAVHRIVPLGERGSGPFPRAVIDVSLPVIPRNADRGDPPAGAAQPVGPVLVPSLMLEDGDSIVVDSIPALNESYVVAITGAVRRPGRYPWRDGMTLRDLMTLARGPSVGAYLKEAEIARLPEDRSQGQRAQTIRVALDSTYLLSRDSAGRFVGPPGVPFPASGAPDVPLRPYDNVLILRQPEFAMQATVHLDGQVRFPGSYALTSGKERLSDVIERAGGLTALAYSDGLRFVRVTDQVGRINVDLARAMKERGSRFDVALQDGDSIIVPEYQPSVKVTGEVNTPGSVMWEKGRDLEYYLRAAGGTTFKADAGRISVRYANGEVRTRRSALLFFHSDPTPGPAAEIFVPVRDTSVRKPDIVTILGVVAQLVAATVTLVVVARK